MSKLKIDTCAPSPLRTAVVINFLYNWLLIQLLVKLLSGVACALLRSTNTGRTYIPRRLSILFVLKEH